MSNRAISSYPAWYRIRRGVSRMRNVGRGGRYRVKHLGPICGDCDAKASTRQSLKRDTHAQFDEAIST